MEEQRTIGEGILINQADCTYFGKGHFLPDTANVSLGYCKFKPKYAPASVLTFKNEVNNGEILDAC
jgi:hypothetical protein